MFGPERLHGRFANADTLGLEQVVGQFGVGPVGSVKSLFGGPVDHPLAEDGDQIGGQLGLGSLGLAGLESVQTTTEVGVEPALDRAWGGCGIDSDLRVLAAAVGHKNDLDAVSQDGIGGRPEQTLQLANLGVGQANANHEPVLGGLGNPAEDNIDTINRIVNKGRLKPLPPRPAPPQGDKTTHERHPFHHHRPEKLSNRTLLHLQNKRFLSRMSHGGKPCRSEKKVWECQMK